MSQIFDGEGMEQDISSASASMQCQIDALNI